MLCVLCVRPDICSRFRSEASFIHWARYEMSDIYSGWLRRYYDFATKEHRGDSTGFSLDIYIVCDTSLRSFIKFYAKFAFTSPNFLIIEMSGRFRFFLSLWYSTINSLKKSLFHFMRKRYCIYTRHELRWSSNGWTEYIECETKIGCSVSNNRKKLTQRFFLGIYFLDTFCWHFLKRNLFSQEFHWFFCVCFFVCDFILSTYFSPFLQFFDLILQFFTDFSLVLRVFRIFC